MAEQLTPQQYQAVHNRGGKLLVSAAAGSGKTKVLVDRLMTYLMDDAKPANLDDFLIITYTKAAAAELRGKIAAKLTEHIAQNPDNRHLQKQMQRLYLTKISTVHGFCSDILREYAYRLDIAVDFHVADENEARELRNRAMEQILENAYQNSAADPDFRSFVDSQGLGRDDRQIPEILEKVYDSARCHLNPDMWLENCLEASRAEDITDAGETLWGKYLIQDLYSYLDCQISVLKQCVQASECYPEFEKVMVNLNQTVYQLECLRGASQWDQIVSARQVDYGRLVFPKKNPDTELSERIKAARNACKKGLERKLQTFSDTSELVLADLNHAAAAARGLVKLIREFDIAYSSLKRRFRCLDFGDLEHRMLDLLLGKKRSAPTALASEISERYREIMVDEYQDSNGVQDAIFSALTSKKQNCFLVGDVKQSIYQFRLADPGIFLEKYWEYQSADHAQPGQGRKVLLSHNFRSGPEVIEGVNDVFSACMRPQVGGLLYTQEEALREGISHEPLADPGVLLYAVDVQEETYPEEAAFVADRISRMLRNGELIRKNGMMAPVQPDDIVILLRSPGSSAGYFQTALEKQGIRCSAGSGTDLLKTQEIATFRSLLETIQNPRQDIPLLSTLASPLFGFTADDLALIRSRRKKGFFYDALLQDDSEKTVRFLLILSRLRQEARQNTLTGLLEACLNLTRIDSIFAAMPGGDGKRTNLHTFFQLAVDFEKGSLKDLSQFLDHLTALEDRGIGGDGSTPSGCVTIMSIHKSKGLEFPVVFLCNLSRKFNQESLRAQILCDKELGLGLSIADRDKRIRYPSVAKKAIAVKMAADSVSEEMRVLYVAMTRARDRLIMTYASNTLEADLREIAMRMDFDGGELLCRDAICMGDWVLMAALQRTDAGQLHLIGGRPLETKSSQYPWHIEVVTAPDAVSTIAEEVKSGVKLSPEKLSRLKQQLTYRYSHTEATSAPSKQTATGRKGRIKDTEAEENTEAPQKYSRTWSRFFRDTSKTGGIAYGNATHAVMQHIRYENCIDHDAVSREIDSLVEKGILSTGDGQIVNREQIAAFFATDIGRKLRSGANYIREFKFSILDSGRNYGEGLEEEQVLLQGVVDCAMIEDTGITVLDFKTDQVTEETLDRIVNRYRLQVQTYADALSRIFEKPVSASYLYFFRMNRFVKV